MEIVDRYEGKLIVDPEMLVYEYIKRKRKRKAAFEHLKLISHGLHNANKTIRQIIGRIRLSGR